MADKTKISFSPGNIVGYQDENWRIIHVEDLERVLCERVADSRREFIQVNDLMPPQWENSNVRDAWLEGKKRGIRKTDDPVVLKSDLDSLQEKFKRILQILKLPKKSRRELIDEVAEELNVSTRTIFRYVAFVEENPVPEVLLRGVRADKGKSRKKERVHEIIDKNLRDHRYVKEKKSLKDILELVNGDLREEGLKEISMNLLWRTEQNKSLQERLKSQGKERQAEDYFRSKAGKLPDAEYPLCTIQIDHTPIQMCFVDEEDREPIGDGYITLVIECYSRMVLGFYLSLDPPSALSVSCALANAFLPKEDFLKEKGVEGSWPCWGFPDIVLVDNAAELNGTMMDSARQTYRFEVRDRPVGSPHFGGHVESAFNTFMSEIKSIPGTKFSNPVERGDYDSEGRAIFTLDQYESYFTEFLVNDYHLREHRGKGMDRMAPLQKWNKGIFEGDEMPPVGLPDRPTDHRALKVSLLPFKRRTIANGLVRIFGDTYNCASLTTIGGEVDLTKPLEKRKFEVRYDPRDISIIWLLDPSTGKYHDLRSTDPSKGPISLWEFNARKKRLGHPDEEFEQIRYESKKRREKMKDSARKDKKKARREAEKERRRAKGSLSSPPPAPKKTAHKKNKKALDPGKLESLRKRVRPAPIDKYINKDEESS